MVRKVVHRQGLLRMSGRYLAVAGLGFLAGALFFLSSTLDLELERPSLELSDWPQYLDENSRVVPFTARDGGAGVRSVSAVLVQEGREVLLDSKKPPQDDVHVFSGALTLSGAGSSVHEGPAKLRIQVQDRSIWGSLRAVERALVVDRREPELDILAAPRALPWGDVGLLVYRVSESNLVSTGISWKGAAPINAMPVSLIDPKLRRPNLFAVLMAGRGERSVSFDVFAKDVANHTVLKALQMAVSQRLNGERRVKDVVASSVFFRQVLSVGDSALQFLPQTERAALETLRAKSATNDRRSMVEMASYLVNKVRHAELETIRARLHSEPLVERSWGGTMKTAPFGMLARFGDRLVVSDEQGDLVSWVPEGEVIDMLGNDLSVVSPYAGRVRFAGQLPTLGEVVVIDHGAGLASVFYSLNQREVFEGASVVGGQLIAQVGSSGLHFSKALRMLLLVNGTPIDPAPWRDRDLFVSNFQGVLDGVKGSLGIDSTPTE